MPDLQNQVEFDLYITPPKLVLTESKTLLEEGLVPAAKVHVSWKNKKGGISLPDSFLQPGLFEKSSTVAEAAFPDSKPVAEKVDKSKHSSLVSGQGGESREEQLMKRMMGKKKGLGKLGGGSTKNQSSKSGTSSKDDPKSGSKGKPKWFKG
jgi:hypothetical protein